MIKVKEIFVSSGRFGEVYRKELLWSIEKNTQRAVFIHRWTRFDQASRGEEKGVSLFTPHFIPKQDKKYDGIDKRTSETIFSSGNHSPIVEKSRNQKHPAMYSCSAIRWKKQEDLFL